MRQLAPGKTLIEAPTAGEQRHLQELCPLPVDGDERRAGRDRLPGARDAARSTCRSRRAARALGSIERMLAFVAANPDSVVAPQHGFVPHLGSA